MLKRINCIKYNKYVAAQSLGVANFSENGVKHYGFTGGRRRCHARTYCSINPSLNKLSVAFLGISSLDRCFFCQMKYKNATIHDKRW
jgi:hypothetical protein